MERLLADAQKISGVEYDISNLNDVYQAIHVVQTELGITGTTAKEASETLQGSAMMAKASWDNFMGGLADPNQDLGMLVENVVSSFTTFADNLVTRIVELAPRLSEGLNALIEQLGPYIPEVINTLLPTVVSALSALATSIAESLPDVLATIFAAIGDLGAAETEILTSLATGLSENSEELVPAVLTMVTTLIESLCENAPELMIAAVDLVIGIVNGLMDNLDMLVGAALDLVIALATGLAESIPHLIAKGPELIGGIVSGISSCIGTIVEKGAEIVKSLASGISSKIQDIVSKAAEIVKTIKDEISKLPDALKKIGKNIIDGLVGGITEKWNNLKSKVTGVVDSVKGIFTGIKGFIINSPSKWAIKVGGYVMDGLGIGFKNSANSAINGAAVAVKSVSDSLKNKLSSLNSELEEIQKREDERRAADELARHEEEISKLYDELGKAEVSEKQKILDEIADVESEWRDKQTKEAIESEQDKIKAIQTEYDKALSEIEKNQEKLSNKIAGYGSLLVKEDGKTKIGDIDSNITKLKNYDELLTDLKNKGVDGSLMDEILGMNIDDAIDFSRQLLKSDESFEKYIEAWNKQQSLAKEIAAKFYQDELNMLENEFSDKLDVALGKIPDNTKEVGVDSMDGLMEGLRSRQNAVCSTVAGIARDMVAAMRSELDINSPSKKLEKLVGEPAADGVEKGFVDRMKAATAKMQSAVSAENFKSSSLSYAYAGKQASAESSNVKTYYNHTTTEKTPVIELKGSLAGLARALLPELRIEERRTGSIAVQGGNA